MTRAGRRAYAIAGVMFAALSPLVLTPQSRAAEAPEIRSTRTNQVPACVTPERMMAFIGQRNTQLNPKFVGIAEAYRDLGQAWHVRWDYAFFQMALETNFLMFRRGDGSSGDVGSAQNNFAGVGATGGGVPGDRFPDVRTGVAAHIEHLVVYSGERVDRPIATRTRAYQGDIIEISRKLGRPVTFADLSHRWAVDRAYWRNIETLAELFRKTQCTGIPGRAPPLPPLSPPVQVRARAAMAEPYRLGASLPVDAMGAPPATVEATRKSSPLVRTIWRRGDGTQPPAAAKVVPPRPTEVHRPVVTAATGEAPTASVKPPAQTTPVAPLAGDAGKAFSDAAQSVPSGIEGFALSARAALTAQAVAPAAP